jgi:hypothetical protein
MSTEITDVPTLLKALKLSHDQEKLLKVYLSRRDIEFRMLETQLKHLDHQEALIRNLRAELIEATKYHGPQSHAYFDVECELRKMKEHLDSVVKFTKLLDLKSQPSPKDINQYYDIKRFSMKVSQPFPGKYDGFSAAGVPHGEGTLKTSTPSIARIKSATKDFEETWTGQFCMGNPIGRMIGEDNLGNHVEFIQLEGKHQGYEIARFSDGASAHLCTDLTRKGVCIQVVPHDAVPPIKPYGKIQSGIRIVVRRRDQSAGFGTGIYGTIILEEIEEGIVMRSWKYIQDPGNHALESIPKPNLGKQKANWLLHASNPHLKELAHQEILSKLMQSKHPP